MAKLIFDGKEYDFRLELSAMVLYAEEKGIEELKTTGLGDMMKDACLINDYPIMVWAGLKVGADEKGRTFDHSIDEVKEWLRKNPYQYDRAIELINKDQEDPEPGNEKKKAKAKK